MIATRVSWRFAEITNSLVIRLPPRESRVGHCSEGGRLAWVLVSWRCRRTPALLNSNSRWPAVELQSSNTHRPGTTPHLWESAFAPPSPESLSAPEIFLAPRLRSEF